MTEKKVLAQGGKFRGLSVHSLIGEGGMGAAWLASHPVLKIPVVIKTFKGADQKRLFQEAHLAARVRSPFAVQAFDAGIEEGLAFVIQPYIDGIDLGELLESVARLEWPLPVGVLARMMAQAARGLHAVHQAGVVHRDIKPANLFLRGDGLCCVGDFGIAVDALVQADQEPSSGTPYFMAPEQWSHGPVDRRADIYALGATIHNMATGKPPFEVGGALQLAFAHLQKPYARPEGTDPESSYLFAVIDRTMRKAPQDRYPTAEALAVALDVVASTPPAVVRDERGARIGSLRVELIKGDITTQKADVIVSAANWLLIMRVGVAAAIKRAAGQAIEDETKALAPVPMGSVVWTGAGDLDARFIAHAVAALDGAICLQRATLRTLLGAEAREAATIAFPALGTGVGDVPMNLAAHMMLEALRTFASLGPRHVREVRFVLYDTAAFDAWREVFNAM